MFSNPGRILRQRQRQAVIVTTKADKSWRGVLADADDHVLVLRNVEQLRDAESSVVVDGEVILMRADIDFIQRV